MHRNVIILGDKGHETWAWNKYMPTIIYQSISKMNANSNNFYKKISKFKGKIAQEYKIMWLLSCEVFFNIISSCHLIAGRDILIPVYKTWFYSSGFIHEDLIVSLVCHHVTFTCISIFYVVFFPPPPHPGM